MKNRILVFAIIISAILSSCEEDYLDSKTLSTLDESVIFSTPGLAQGAVDGIKVPFGETNSYRGRFLPWYGMNTDIEWYNASESTSNDNATLCNYNALPNNTQMNTSNNAWDKMYQGIERANICIRGLRTYGNPTAGSELGYLLGEALTLRAVYYADLLKAWGDVPARFEPISSETLYLPKSNRDIIYKQLIQDLGEAADLVPWPNGNAATGSVERVNKAFVKGLRARLALAASGFQQYPDGVRKSNDPELSVQNMYTLAFNECKAIIDSGTAHLEPTFEGLWKKYNQENTQAGGESLWEIPFSAGRGRMLFTFAVRHTNNDQYHSNGNNRGGQAGPLPFIFYDYDEADARRDVTCVPYLWGPATNGFAKQQLGALNKWYFGKYRYEWMNRIVTSTNDDGVNKIYMRYAEILLMAAETANELQGPSAAAPYLKELRMRAFDPSLHPTKVDAYVNALGSKQQMFDAIVEEHKYEFTGEMERKQALIRWNLLETKLVEAKAKMFDLQQRAGDYFDVPSTLYYKYATDNETLIIYGLNRNENTVPGPDYTAFQWDNLTDSKINALYSSETSPNNRQFWPIWQVFLDSSNGTLVNDYGY
ncbi:RagB/SusD family nutrient uptake outer membrane protein [Flavobacterium sp. NRK F7]|uniref:RagB/SusD family nutrient uptake outer membrane protein n=1 Tax=Flavobacterium sp. NRK F7 TaxID=2954930 RepID=UPI0020908F77|nr:RagB/SusD family nutrient uptake outer membrane protein [Flavobacterium sp. NRK F7]MCO6163398.1 RagB/SusD family nutrient uptake outer membrane protein [Flavobacterium sp. NRK F7]